MGETSNKPKAKPARPDIAEKRKRQREYRQYVVKACLRKYIKGDDEFKDKVVKAIKLRVESASQRIVFASRSLSWLLKEAFYGEAKLENVQLPNIFDGTFIRQMMLGTENSRKENLEITNFYEKHPDMLKNKDRYLGDRNIYSHAAKKYLTNLKTSLSMNFMPRLKKYLNICFLTQPERVYTLYSIMGWKVPKNILDLKIGEERKHVVNIVKEQRSLLSLKEGQEITEAWLKCESNLQGILKQYVFYNRLGDDLYKEFDIVPISKVRHSFITIDNETFLDMMVELEVIKSSKNILASDIWKSVFDTGKGSFTGTIDTDGVSVCFHYEKLRKEKNEETKEICLEDFQDPNLRQLACDPGRANIYTIVEIIKGDKKKNKKEDKDEEPLPQVEIVKTWSLNRKRFYNESGIFKARKQTEHWTKTIRVNLDSISRVSSKGVDIRKHENYNRVFLENFNNLWSEYTKKHWADQRLRLYGGKKRCLARFWNEVLGPEDKREKAVIAYGAAKFAPSGKGEISVPTSQAFKACLNQKHLKTVLVDEFRSSKIDYKSEQLLKTVKVQGKDKPLRGLLWCESTSQNSKQGTFVNRDVNAALNILRCATQLERPKILTRKFAKIALPKQEIGKVLRCCVAR